MYETKELTGRSKTKLRLLWVAGAALVIIAGFTAWHFHKSKQELTIKVGILHSRTGAMAISEKSMVDGEMLAIEEINAKADCWAGASSRSLPTENPTGRRLPKRQSD